MPPAVPPLLIACAAFNAAFGVFHLTFWRVFRWRDELPKLAPVNRGILQVLNVCLTFAFFAFAAALVHLPGDVWAGRGGRFALAAAAVFWLVRTLCQPLFFGLRHPASGGMTAVFFVGTLLHGGAWWIAGTQ